MVDLPPWTPFDAGAVSELPDHEARPGRLVTVVASPAAVEQGWALDSVISLAGGWSAAGIKVVLADARLEAPTIHQQFGEANREGVVDVVEFGSSVRRVARPAPDAGYFYISAGSPTADPGSVLASPRWDKLSDGFVDAGVTLIAYACGDSPGVDKLLGRATDVVVLAGEGEDVQALVSGAVAPVRWVMGVAADSADTRPAIELAGDEDEDPEAHLFGSLVEDAADDLDEGVEEAEEAAPAEGPDAEAEEPAAEVPEEEHSTETEVEELEAPAEEAAADDSADLPDVEASIIEAAEGPEEKARPDSRPAVIFVLSVVILGIVTAASMGLVQIPGLTPEAPPPPPVEQSVTPAARSVPVTAETPSLTHSVAVGAFQDAAVAASTMARLESVSGVLLAVAPVSVDGTVFHRVLVGPASDQASAEELAARVSQESGLDRSGWVVRETSLGFILGEMSEQDDAMLRLDALLELDVPAYVLAIEYQDGSTRYRLYAGAFADEAEAEYLRSHLEAQGLENASLAPRMGRVP